MDYLYFVVSQTGTLFSRVLRQVNGAQYNHVSLALDNSLEELYSFGRQCLYFPLAAGFVRERPNRGIYCRYSDATCAVYRVPVSRRELAQLRQVIFQFERQEWKYRYNLLGLPVMLANIPLHRSRHFVCSQFVAYVLEQSGIQLLDKDFSLVRPQDFASLPGAELIYEGRVNDYGQAAPAFLFAA